MGRLPIPFITALMILLNVLDVFAANVTFDTSQLDCGIVKVSSLDPGSKLKVLVKKDEWSVSYNLAGDGTAESFPLQMGNGIYKISVLENIEASNYRYLSTKKLKLDLENQNIVYLASIQNVKWDESMESVKWAHRYAKGIKEQSETIYRIYDYIVDNYKFDKNKLNNLSYDYLPDIDETFQTKSGICYDFSSTFAAMLRSLGIPAKLVKGRSRNTKGYHAWNEIYDSEEGRWITVDTTFDSQMKAAGRSFSMEKPAGDYTKVYAY